MRTRGPDTERLLQLASEKLSSVLENNPSPELRKQVTESLQLVALHQRLISKATRH
jgi:hypothetical protein